MSDSWLFGLFGSFASRRRCGLLERKGVSPTLRSKAFAGWLRPFLLILAICIGSSTTRAQQVEFDLSDLVAWYDFDDALDSSLNGYNLSPEGSPQYSDGFGSALNETSSYWVAPIGPHWGRPSSSYSCMVRFRKTGPGVGNPYVMNSNNWRNMIRFNGTVRIGGIFTPSIGSYVEGEWYTVYFEFDKDAQLGNASLDNGSFSSAQGNFYSSNSNAILGATNPDNIQNLDFDYAVFFNRKLTSVERSQIYNDGNTVTLSELQSSPTYDHYVALDGVDDYISTPDSETNSVTGSIEIVAKVAADDWTPTVSSTILSKYNSVGPDRAFVLSLTSSGAIQLFLSDSLGSLEFETSTASVPFANGQSGWIRATYDIAATTARIYTSGVPRFPRVSDWNQLGADLTGFTLTDIKDVGETVSLGAWWSGSSTTQRLSGKIYYAEIHDGIGGPVVSLFNASEGTNPTFDNIGSETAWNGGTFGQDGGGLSNQVPVLFNEIESIPNAQVGNTVGEYVHEFAADHFIDPDGSVNGLIWLLDGDSRPAWLDFDTSGGSFSLNSIVPAGEANNVYNFTIQVIDLAGDSSPVDSFTFTVDPAPLVNTAPYPDVAIDAPSGTEDDPSYNFQLPPSAFKDDEDDPFTWHVTAPSWVNVADNGTTTRPTLSGMPDAGSVGAANTVTIYVSDGEFDSDPVNFDISVAPAAGEGDPEASTNPQRFSNSATGADTDNDGSIIDLADSDLVIKNREAASIRLSTAGQERLTIDQNGYIGIGTSANLSAELQVAGTIQAEKIVVSTSGADFVFEDGYNLKSLEEVQSHIEAHGHLPNVPSAAQMQQEGLSLGESQTLLLQKIEELTLYIIEQNKRIESLEAKLVESSELSSFENRSSERNDKTGSPSETGPLTLYLIELKEENESLKKRISAIEEK